MPSFRSSTPGCARNSSKPGSSPTPATTASPTGDRPTGPLHLGHLFGTLQNRVRLQDLGVVTMVLIADYQTITDRDSPASLPRDVEELMADYLAVGIDPARSTIFAHSQVPALNQLMLPFLSLVSVPELARNPTVKEEQAAAGLPTASGLLFTYPVHQAADILFCHGNVVPVGKDQLPHVEITRVIARRFNQRYSPDEPYFPEPAALLSEAPVLLGTDGQKMSKSRGNAIAIGASADETAPLIRAARTDATRHITYDPVARPAVSTWSCWPRSAWSGSHTRSPRKSATAAPPASSGWPPRPSTSGCGRSARAEAR